MQLFYYVYILQTTDRKLYVGQTRGLAFRWAQHISGSGAWFLVAHKPASVELVVKTRTRKEALELEDFWKTTLRSDRNSAIISFLGQVDEEYIKLFKLVKQNFTPRLCQRIQLQAS